LHARQQTLAMLDTVSGEVVNRTLMHEGNEVREFYSELPRPVLVGVEAMGPMQWFLNLLEELGIERRRCISTAVQAFGRRSFLVKSKSCLPVQEYPPPTIPCCFHDLTGEIVHLVDELSSNR
jgi:hypothetical protein